MQGFFYHALAVDARNIFKLFAHHELGVMAAALIAGMAGVQVAVVAKFEHFYGQMLQALLDLLLHGAHLNTALKGLIKISSYTPAST